MDDVKSIRQRLAVASGPEYWRCLEELADSAAFKELVSREAPRHSAAWLDALDRRDFLRLMGASLANGIHIVHLVDPPRSPLSDGRSNSSSVS